jgi:hypothetical protein
MQNDPKPTDHWWWHNKSNAKAEAGQVKPKWLMQNDIVLDFFF